MHREHSSVLTITASNTSAFTIKSLRPKKFVNIEMASETSNSTLNGGGILPSLFNSGSASVLTATKELESLMTMNDNTLSQQIEFILQDSPMDHHDHDDGSGNITEVELAVGCNSAAIKQENPPNNYTNTSTSSSFTDYSLSNSSLAAEEEARQRQQQQQQQLMNGSRYIIQATGTARALNDDIKTELDDDAVMDTDDEQEEDPDPELNDENLQDIEEEAQSADADDEVDEPLRADIKLERMDDQDEMETLQQQHISFVNGTSHTNGVLRSMSLSVPTSTITAAHQPENLAQSLNQSHQLMIPAGTIVSNATSRTLSVPVSEALMQLQRRPVYISNAMGGMAGTTFVRMPAVISRSPMAVLNVVQQNTGNGQTQLILQAAPGTNTGGAPVVVSSSSPIVGPTQVSTIVPAANTLISASVPASTIISSVSGNAINASRAQTSYASASPTSRQQSLTTIAPATTVTIRQVQAPINTTVVNAESTPASAFQCIECVEKFDSKELFEIHRSGHANNMKCAICNMVLKSLKNYEKHCLRCKPYECQICGRVVRFRPNFIKHMRVHTGQQQERHKYKCDVCHKEFMSFEYFKVHKKIHNDNVNLTCDICGKVFSALASLRGHSKLHSGVKLHKCEVCGKGFGQRYNLKIHARTHTGDFPFECKICKKKLHTQSSLQTHLQVHQRDQNAQSTSSSAKLENVTVSAPTKSAAVKNTIIKVEPPSIDYDGPSTSGLQQQSSTLSSQPAATAVIPRQYNNGYHDNDTDGDDDDETENDYDDNNNLNGLFEDSSVLSDSFNGGRNLFDINTTGRNMQPTTADDSSEEDSSNASREYAQQLQQHLLGNTNRSVVIRNYTQAMEQPNVGVIAQQQTHVIQGGATISNAMQQQMMRKTPIIHSTGGAVSLTSVVGGVLHQTGYSPSASPSSSSTSCSSSVVVSKSGAPLSLNSAVMGTPTIRSTHNDLSNHRDMLSNNHRNNLNINHHSNNHRSRHLTPIDDDDDDDLDDLRERHRNHQQQLNNQNHQRQRATNGQHFDDDDDDEISSPSLAATAIIKVEPNLYSSGSGDNSNEMLIKQEVLFVDSSSNPTSNYNPDLVDHHVDLSQSLPPYGVLFEQHSIQDTIPTRLYSDEEEDFRLDRSPLDGLPMTRSTTDGEFMKREWSYNNTNSSNKHEDDNDNNMKRITIKNYWKTIYKIKIRRIMKFVI